MAAAPAPAATATLRPALETTLERLGSELLRQQRSDRRWRTFFRLAWLGVKRADERAKLVDGELD